MEVTACHEEWLGLIEGRILERTDLRHGQCCCLPCLELPTENGGKWQRPPAGPRLTPAPIDVRGFDERFRTVKLKHLLLLTVSAPGLTRKEIDFLRAGSAEWCSHAKRAVTYPQ